MSVYLLFSSFSVLMILVVQQEGYSARVVVTWDRGPHVPSLGSQMQVHLTKMLFSIVAEIRDQYSDEAGAIMIGI